MLVIVLKNDFDVKNPNLQLSYCGSPCRNFEEAAESVYNRRMWGCDYKVEFVNNGMNYIEIEYSYAAVFRTGMNTVDYAGTIYYIRGGEAPACYQTIINGSALP